MTLQQALHALIRDSEFPAKKIAEEAGIAYGYLMKAADEMQPEFQLQARLVAPITRASQDDRLIKQIAHDCGGSFVRIPCAGSAPSSVLGAITDISREFADATAALTSCLDGTTPKEKIAAIQQLTELIDRAAAAREQLQATVAK